MHFFIALRKVRWIISYSLRGLETRLRFCSSSSRLVSPGPQFGVSYIFFARLLPPTVADQGLEAAAVVVRLVQPGGENEIILTFLPPLNSPTSAPSSSPAPQTPISRPAIDPGAAPCACGCTFIVHAGHRGAKHNHVRKPKHFTPPSTSSKPGCCQRDQGCVRRMRESAFALDHQGFRILSLSSFLPAVVFVTIMISIRQGASTTPPVQQPDSLSSFLPCTLS